MASQSSRSRWWSSGWPGTMGESGGCHTRVRHDGEERQGEKELERKSWIWPKNRVGFCFLISDSKLFWISKWFWGFNFSEVLKTNIHGQLPHNFSLKHFKVFLNRGRFTHIWVFTLNFKCKIFLVEFYMMLMMQMQLITNMGCYNRPNVFFHAIMHPCAKIWSISTCLVPRVLITSSSH
jgi:hypothetical protein